MSNDNNNDNNDTTGGADVIDLAAIRAAGKTPSRTTTPIKPRIASGKYEFHLYPSMDNEQDDLVGTEGFLKFGPQFIAVVDGPEDDSQVLFAVQTALVKYVKRLGSVGEIQGTLSL